MGETIRQSGSFWRQHVERWRESGLSRGEYCARQGLSRRTFGWWAWRLARDDRGDAERGAPRFLAIETEPSAPDAAVMTASAPGGPSIEIALPDGVAVRVGADVDVAALRRVLQALGR